MSRRFADGAARVCRLYGVSPLLGRLFAAVFLSPRPLSLEELTAQVGAAKSSVSVAIRQLLRVRVIQRVDVDGDRRDFYAAVEDPWTVLADWTRLYFRPELEMWSDVTDDALRTLERSDAAATGGRDKLVARVTAWRGVIDVFDVLLAQVARRAPGGTVDGSGAVASSWQPAAARTVKIDIEGA